MTSPAPYVPPRFIPDDDVVLGEPPELALGPEITAEERAEALAQHTPDCPVCGADMMELEPSRGHYCVRCDERDPRTRDQELRREARLREAHNDGSFMPVSVSEWYENDQL